MEPRTALTVALVAGGLAVALVAADTVWGLHLTVQAEAGEGWQTLWRDPGTAYEERFVERPVYGPSPACYGPAFQLVAVNDKPFPDSVDVRVVYFDNETKTDRTLTEQTVALGPFEQQAVRWTVPASAGAPASPYRGKDDPWPPADIRVVIDGGWPRGHDLSFCTKTGGDDA